MTNPHRSEPRAAPSERALDAVPAPEGPDADIVARLRAGDVRVYDALFKQHYAALCRFATSYAGAPDIAEEIVQDVLYRVWQRRAILEVRTTLLAFLYGLVRNRGLNEARHQRIVEQHVALVSDDDVPPGMAVPVRQADQPLLASEIQAAIDRVLASVPATAQRAYRLRYDEQLSYAEIAEALGLSIKRIESLMLQVRNALREALAAYL